VLLISCYRIRKLAAYHPCYSTFKLSSFFPLLKEAKSRTDIPIRALLLLKSDGHTQASAVRRTFQPLGYKPLRGSFAHEFSMHPSHLTMRSQRYWSFSNTRKILTGEKINALEEKCLADFHKVPMNVGAKVKSSLFCKPLFL